MRNLTGARLHNRRVNGEREVVVGDFLADAGEEIAVETDSGLLVYNPFSKTESTLSVSGDVLVDHINVSSFRQEGSSGGSSGENGSESGGGEETGGTAPAGSLGAVCSSTRAISHGILWKPAADASDSRQHKPVVLLTGSSKTNTGSLAVYASNGTQVCTFSFKASSIQGVNGGADHYFSGWPGGCSLNASQIASKARQASGSSDVYFKWKGGSCIGPLNPTSRSGSI